MTYLPSGSIRVLTGLLLRALDPGSWQRGAARRNYAPESVCDCGPYEHLSCLNQGVDSFVSIEFSQIQKGEKGLGADYNGQLSAQPFASGRRQVGEGLEGDPDEMVSVSRSYALGLFGASDGEGDHGSDGALEL
jgi:hypothetical protein